MKRRKALKSLSLSLGGVLSMPIWSSCWTPESLPNNNIGLGSEQELLLSEIVDALIPASSTPGAKELKVPQFVQAMIYDCFEKEDQQNFIALLEQIDKFSNTSIKKNFRMGDLAERTEILEYVENQNLAAPQRKFTAYPVIKELTIQGYLNSEYVMTHIYKYELVPGRFNGSFPVANPQILTGK